MGVPVPFILYLLAAALVAAWLTLRLTTSRRFITAVLSFWILGGSILNQDQFAIPFPVLSGDLQPGRIMLLVLLAYAVLVRLFPSGEQIPKTRMSFEKWLFLYAALFFIVLFYHFLGRVLPSREFIRLGEGLLRVLVIYVLLKRYADQTHLRVLFYSAIILAVVTSLVAVVQFAVDPWFLRVGDTRLAFGGHLRSNGVFWSEYMHSYFLVLALVLVIVFVKRAGTKILLSSLFVLGILLSFHRMSWAVTGVVGCLYLILARRQPVWKLVTVTAVLLFLFYGMFSEFFPMARTVESSAVFQERLSSNTMSSRFKYFGMVIDQFDKIFIWGAGSKTSSLYYYGMLSTGIVDRDWALGRKGSIHNLYLEILFLYGLPVAAAFCAALVAILHYFIIRFRRGASSALLAILFFTMFILMNLTNAFPLDGQFGVTVALVLGCNAALRVQTIRRRQIATGDTAVAPA